MGRDPDYLRFIRNVADALAAAGSPGLEVERERFREAMAREPRAQGLAYAERLRGAGVPVHVVDADGLDHAFLAWGTYARRPARAIAELGEAVRTMPAAGA